MKMQREQKLETTRSNLMSKKQISEDWVPSHATLERMTELFPGVDIQYEQEKFVDYYLSNGGVSANWEAAFRNWIRRADEYDRSRGVRESGHTETNSSNVSNRRKRILRVAKSGNTTMDGSVKRLPSGERD